MLKNILKGPFSPKNKSKIFNSCIIPTIIYDAQSWTLTSNLANKLRVTQNTMERSMLGVRKSDRIKMTKIKKQLKNNKNIMVEARKRIWDWAGHVARIGDNRWTRKINWWSPCSRRRRGRQRARWRDPISGFLMNNNFESVAQDRTEWQRLREAFAHNVGLEH